MTDDWLSMLMEEKKEKDPLEDYALYIDAGRHSSDFILYEPKYYAQKMKNEILNAKKEFNKIRFKGEQFGNFKDFYAFSNVKDVFKDTDGIVGFMSINNGRIIGMRGSCNRANEIRSISARTGFGRLMFMIALAKESPIMPNRKEVSTKAYDYWDMFSADKSIDKDKFGNEMSLSPKETEDCKVFGDRILDQSYKTPTDIGIEAQPLINRHNIFLNQMKNYFKKGGVDYILSRVKDYIADAGTAFHDENEGETSWYQSFNNEDD